VVGRGAAEGRIERVERASGEREEGAVAALVDDLLQRLRRQRNPLA
jgi:hypothetical protein